MTVTWPVAEVIETSRMTLEPLRVEHAAEMAPLLDDERLHSYIGGHPATMDQLRARYRRLVAGQSPDGTQGWLNWIARLHETGSTAGTVQATLHPEHGQVCADVAWVIASRYQGKGYASEAAAGMAAWLANNGTAVLVAFVHPGHQASIGVARHLGLTPTTVVVDGETRWESRY